MITAPYKRLPWDSEFFGYEVFMADSQQAPEQLARTLEQLKGQARLVYLASPEELDAPELLQSYNGKLVDVKTTYAKPTSASAAFPPAVSFYEGLSASEQLIRLSIAAGIYSRYNTDPAIGRDKYEAMYRIWAERSANRSLAKYILICQEGPHIAGMVTLGEKNGRADIGLVAVDASSRGKGTASMLMEAAEHVAFREGYQEIQVVTQRFNIPACRLYEKSGYKVIKEEYFYHFWL
ncbi:GNAT family N-acetyltransferase [Chitinophaga vietnamensis]|uniref:GNAT family N-acetyltransferase n=1 Tax=Chitinophaga vietnamensis TaxID=2593957 RepID=UPI001177FC2B|nr:GNAT family N-acetyltransferase [Chitinophaga vietnamensis]